MKLLYNPGGNARNTKKGMKWSRATNRTKAGQPRRREKEGMMRMGRLDAMGMSINVNWVFCARPVVCST